MNWIIDRIENNVAVCEFAAGKTVDIPLDALPSNATEGDVITLSVNPSQTSKRKEKINNLMNGLFKD